MIVTDSELLVWEQAARRFAGAWTGTSGTLASHLIHAIYAIRRLQEQTMTGGQKMLSETSRVLEARRATYGPPADHFTRTVAAVNAIFAHKLVEPLTAADWAQIMILDKLARNQGTARTPDTPVDIAGYAACLAEVQGD